MSVVRAKNTPCLLPHPCEVGSAVFLSEVVITNGTGSGIEQDSGSAAAAGEAGPGTADRLADRLSALAAGSTDTKPQRT